MDCVLSTGLGADSALSIEDHLTFGGVDECFPGYCLCVGDVDCPPGAESVLELVRNAPGGTLGDTVTASGTGVFVDIPGFLPDGDSKVSGFSLDLLDLSVGQAGDVGVSSCIRHFRGQDTCGTVVGREGFVQTAHRTTDGGEPIYEIDVDVPVCKVQ